MTKSPPSTLGVNVGLCLPRSRVAAVTARRPSTTSVASMTYHDRVVSPAFGTYVGTALTCLSLGVNPGMTRVPVRRRRAGCSRRPTVTRAPADRTPSQQLTGGHPRRSKRRSGQPYRRMTVRSRRLPSIGTNTASSWPLPSPDTGRLAVSARDIVGAGTHRVAEVDQHLVERGGRVLPPELFDAVGGGGFPGPEFLQWRDLRSQLFQGGVEAGRRGVDLLANAV